MGGRAGHLGRSGDCRSGPSIPARDRFRHVPELLRFGLTDFCHHHDILRDHRHPRCSLRDRQEARPSAPRCHSCGWLGKLVHPPRSLAIPCGSGRCCIAQIAVGEFNRRRQTLMLIHQRDLRIAARHVRGVEAYSNERGGPESRRSTRGARREAWGACRAGARGERIMELLLIADLFRDLRRRVQDFQDPGQQVDAAHGGSGRHIHDRRDLADDELQPSLHEQCAYLFYDHAHPARSQGTRGRGASPAEHSTEARRRTCSASTRSLTNTWSIRKRRCSRRPSRASSSSRPPTIRRWRMSRR